MPTRTPHTGVAGEVLTAANLAKYPKGWLGYASVTSNQSGIGSTPTDLTGLTVTVTVPANRLVRVSGYAQVFTASGVYAAVTMLEDGSQVGRVGRTLPGVGESTTVSAFTLVLPTAGSHTYKLQGESSSSTFTLEASSSLPAWILVEDIGPSS
jgi:hypothetical protein